MPAMRAKSSNASVPTAVDMTVWCAAPAVSQAVAEAAKLGSGRQTARPTGRCGSGARGSTISTPLAARRVDL
jgi:hypothetical protein